MCGSAVRRNTKGKPEVPKELDMTKVDTTDRVVVVTSDSHVGPSLTEHLRRYCPSSYLEQFDAFAAAATDPTKLAGGVQAKNRGIQVNDAKAAERLEKGRVESLYNAQGTGSYDVYQRLRDMDRDGVAAEVIFHGTANADGVFDLIPFQWTAFSDVDSHVGREERELGAVGRHIYNQWLADFCSVEPARHVGLAQVPIWDIEASIREVEWAAEHGLKGVNFPYPQPELPSFEDPMWDPFFSACASLRMPLSTHIGSKIPAPFVTGGGSYGVRTIEKVFYCGRGLWHLIFSGAFERHPQLKFSIHEVPGTWWSSIVADMDSTYDDPYRGGPELRDFLPQRPSHYVKRNVVFGASFQSPVESRIAVESGLSDRVMWGSDYPHSEGTWLYPEDETKPSTTRLSLAHCLAGLDEADLRSMAGRAAMSHYQLDEVALAAVAERIGPSIAELSNPPDLGVVPDHYTGLGFRTVGVRS
jgi:predicted TIM-barrel fold metal-dependent hydrolase